MIPSGLLAAAKDPRFRRRGGTELRALVILHDELTYYDERPLKLAVLVHALGIRKQNVSLAVLRLVRFGYVTRRFDETGTRLYRLTPPLKVTPRVTTRPPRT